ncbi:C4-dicarboxylate ABC transporter [Microlunatus endophyticus]|uniref:C4-dicarboxylate ABC transporter n=1 Tax=Microlunatus endophyticus TaxID=1716077 RepID=A0A917SEK3_9ACTN|nr:TDT family transporter [Microlunatus endophyticus]GGL74806.1 C4-dicarboxylate ABC transporter [Microlunatus endophyticus]
MFALTDRQRPTAPPRGRRLFTELDHPRLALSNLTPNWFAAVMGTGIVANSSVLLPLSIPGVADIALVIWIWAAVLLFTLIIATVAHWLLHPGVARGHHTHPVFSHFYGAVPMAFLTVGSGALVVGRRLIGLQPALAVDTVLWTLGTIGGLVTACAIPYLQFTRERAGADRSAAPPQAFGGWLMPIVPPMVSATTGAQLLGYLPAGQARLTLYICCAAMFGLTLFASLPVIMMIWSRLAHHDLGPAAMVPTLWIVLGPLGQSITAAGLLGSEAKLVVPADLARALYAAGLGYGILTLGFALLWTGIAAAITLRTARRGLPFSLTWWSFTFPIGTCVTGLSGLATHTGSALLVGLAVIYFAALVIAWATVTVRTVHGSIIRGTLLAPAG